MKRRFFRDLADKNYHLAKLYARWAFFRSDLGGGAPIIVYQMGKVGSSSVVASLKTLRLKHPVYHVHSLAPAGIENGKRMYKRMFKNAERTDFRRAGHLFASQHLCRKMAKATGAETWKVVSLVRDPVAINVSGFFQIIDHYLPHFSRRYHARAVTIADAIRVFLNDYDHEEPLTWFDVELKSTLGVDVFATKFPKAKGYEIYKREHIEVLILRLEDMNECAEAAFKQFLDIENFSLINANISEEKNYQTAYREFKDAIHLPCSYLDTVYESRHVKHFYTDEEISGFKARWRRL